MLSKKEVKRCVLGQTGHCNLLLETTYASLDQPRTHKCVQSLHKSNLYGGDNTLYCLFKHTHGDLWLNGVFNELHKLPLS